MDEPISRSRQLRGRLAVGVRHCLTQPVSRRLPASALRQYHRIRRRLVPQRYTDADPCVLLWVDPDRISQSLLESAPTYPQWGRVVDGSWDLEGDPFGERAVVRAIRQRFEGDTAWDETPLVAAYREQLERFGNAWEQSSMAAFETRCQEIDALYDSIRTHGYQPVADRRPELGGTVAGLIAEINVDIGRAGDICWRGYGQHRLAIAQLLGIERVPVVVNRRHRQWQTVRDRLREDGKPDTIPPQHRAHPDLQDLIGQR